MDAAAANLVVARNYLKAIEERRIPESFADFFAPHAVIETMPNRLVPKGRPGEP